VTLMDAAARQPDADIVTNRCACGWEVTGPAAEVVDATIDHGRRVHNMVATRDQVLIALGRSPGADAAPVERP